MAGIGGYLHNVGPEDVQIVDIRAEIQVVTTFTIQVEVQE